MFESGAPGPLKIVVHDEALRHGGRAEKVKGGRRGVEGQMDDQPRPGPPGTLAAGPEAGPEPAPQPQPPSPGLDPPRGLETHVGRRRVHDAPHALKVLAVREIEDFLSLRRSGDGGEQGTVEGEMEAGRPRERLTDGDHVLDKARARRARILDLRSAG